MGQNQNVHVPHIYLHTHTKNSKHHGNKQQLDSQKLQEETGGSLDHRVKKPIIFVSYSIVLGGAVPGYCHTDWGGIYHPGI